MTTLLFYGATSCASIANARAEAPPLQLLSISHLDLAANEFLLGFHIDTWAVSVLAVCHRPVGYVMKAGDYDGSDGELSGEAGLRHYTAGELYVLDDLFLVRVNISKGKIPPNFQGKARISTFADKQGRLRNREIAITGANISLRPAERCPDPMPQ